MPTTIVRLRRSLQKREEWKRRLAAEVLAQVSGREVAYNDYWRLSFDHPFTLYANVADIDPLVASYIPLLAYPALRDALMPYAAARLAPSWRAAFPPLEQYIPLILSLLLERKLPDERERQRWRFGRPPDDGKTHFAVPVLESFRDFLRQHGEGAVLVLLLLQTARRPDRWILGKTGEAYTGWIDAWYRGHYARLNVPHGQIYPRDLTMIHLPAIVGREPFELLLLVERIRRILPSGPPDNICAKYYWRSDSANHYKRERPSYSGSILVRPYGEPGAIERALRETADVQLLWKELTSLSTFEQDISLENFIKAPDADKNLVITYLMCRACDIVLFGEPVADLTFPQPSIKLTNVRDMSRCVSNMVALLQSHIGSNEDKEDRQTAARFQEYAQDDFEREFSKRSLPVPACLPPRMLTDDERDELKKACLEELLHGGQEGWNVTATLDGIDELVGFCGLLSQPENHIWVRTGQYKETVVNTRTEHDMAHEMARKLRDLAPHAAYARVIEEREGRRRLVKRRIVTPPPLETPEAPRAAVPLRLAPGVYKDRARIEAEIRQRQARWRGERSLPPRTSQGPAVPPSEKPPPTSY